MYSTIDKFAKSGLISRDEAIGAIEAENAGVESHTIGYEVEVLPSAKPDIARATKETYIEDLYWRCHDKLGPYGYTVGQDGLYELQSPAATHAYPLAIATRGLAGFGWLPKKGTKGIVTSHVSIGTSETPSALSEDHGVRLIEVLRSIEMLGGTTPGRLMTPTRKAEENNWVKADVSWNQKGTAGVKLQEYDDNASEGTHWKGENNRVEFRTLGYYNPKQFGAMLNAVYYLTRGLVQSPETTAGAIYTEYHNWLQDYYDYKGLPEINDDLLDSPEDAKPLAEYIVPYVEHLANEDLSLVRDMTIMTIGNLREEFAMTAIPLDMNNLSSQHPLFK